MNLLLIVFNKMKGQKLYKKGVSLRFVILLISVLSVGVLMGLYVPPLPSGQNSDKSRFKKYIESRIPAIEKSTLHNKIILLRDFAYKQIKVDSGGDFSNRYENLVDIFEKKTPLLCGGIGQAYMALLEAYDIPVRLVQLLSQGYLDGNEPNETHVVTEVFYNNKWIIEDPTFNVEFKYNGNLLSLKELKYLYDQGLEPEIDNNDFDMIKRRSIGEYYIDYDKLLARTRIFELSIWG